MISLIVAMDEKGGIGYKDTLPWRLSDDLRRFKKLTMGHHLILGRKTYQSIGRPLPGRRIIVLTRDTQLDFQGVEKASSLEEAVNLAQSRGDAEIFIGGGATIYQQALPIADRIYLTRVHAQVEADVFFPEFDLDDWEELSSETVASDANNQYASTFQVLDRKVLDAPMG